MKDATLFTLQTVRRTAVIGASCQSYWGALYQVYQACCQNEHDASVVIPQDLQDALAKQLQLQPARAGLEQRAVTLKDKVQRRQRLLSCCLDNHNISSADDLRSKCMAISAPSQRFATAIAQAQQQHLP